MWNAEIVQMRHPFLDVHAIANTKADRMLVLNAKKSIVQNPKSTTLQWAAWTYEMQNELELLTETGY